MAAQQDPTARGPQPGPEKQHLTINVRTVAIVILAILLLIFVFQNSRSVPIRFWIPEVTSPLWIALLLAVALGVLVGLLLGRLRYRTDRPRHRTPKSR